MLSGVIRSGIQTGEGDERICALYGHTLEGVDQRGADDVKCTHGAAVGQLDEEALFYLQARGLTRLEARDMLLHAFAGEVMEGLKIPALREQIETNFFTALARDVALQPLS